MLSGHDCLAFMKLWVQTPTSTTVAVEHTCDPQSQSHSLDDKDDFIAVGLSTEKHSDCFERPGEEGVSKRLHLRCATVLDLDITSVNYIHCL